MPSVNIDGDTLAMLVNTLIDFIEAKANERDFELNVDNYSILIDVYHAMNKQPLSDPENKDYYDLFSSKYSHNNLKFCEEAVGCVLALFN